MKGKPGDWVILKNDKIVAADKDLNVILSQIESFNKNEVIISMIPYFKYQFY